MIVVQDTYILSREITHLKSFASSEESSLNGKNLLPLGAQSFFF